MKIIITGGREFTDYALLKRKCDIYLSNIREDIVIVSGMARGTDMLGVTYAVEKAYEILPFPANWDKYGKGAGFIRNKDMAKIADYAIAFWDGQSRGTCHMIQTMCGLSKPIKVVRY